MGKRPSPSAPQRGLAWMKVWPMAWSVRLLSLTKKNSNIPPNYAGGSTQQSAMKLKFWSFDLQLTHPWRISRGLDMAGADSYAVIFVELSEADGRGGLGESAPSGRYHETVDTVQS